MTGVGRGTHDGTPIRDAESLQHPENANTLAVAETGTLTEGRPKHTRRECVHRFIVMLFLTR